MKSKVIFLLLICVTSLLAQSQRLDNSIDKEDLIFYSLFEVSQNSSILNTKKCTKNIALIDFLEKNEPLNFNSYIEYEGETLEFSLRKSKLLSDNFQIKDHRGNQHSFTGLYYRGIVLNDKNSIVTLAIVDGVISLWVVMKDTQFEINKVGADYFLTNSVETINKQVSCLTVEGEMIDLNRNLSTQRNQANCIDIAVEVDYEMYVANNNDISQLSAWATSVFNNVATLYENEGVPIYMSGIVFHTTPDNYTSDLIQSLNEFVTSNASGIQGKLAFLMSGKAMGGGISQGIGGYCNSLTAYPGPFAIAGDMTVPSIDYPTYSYNVMIMGHELGHVMGLRHTHACVWNGNSTQIDDCGNVYAFDNGQTPEGTNCFDQNNPILPGNDGTIMSNCHLLNNTAINFALGFGTEPGMVLYNNFINASCSLGDNCRDIVPINDLCIEAIPLVLTNTCELRTYDNMLATSSGSSPGVSCGSSGALVDVWFSVQIPSSGSVTIETGQVTNGLTDMVIQTYTGTCGNLTQLTCDDNSGSGNHAQVQLTNRTPNEIILIRIIENGSDLFGDFGLCAYDSSIPCHPDFDALIDFYTDMNGPSWTNNIGWIDGAANTDCNVCNWNGVVCNAYNRVREINLPSNNLVGGLSPSLVNLPFLDKINLYTNLISGVVPTFLKDISLLDYVDLGFNSLNGSLPTEIGNCPNLRTLFIDNNSLTGILPSNLVLTPITTFWINNNDLSGCIPNTYFEFCNRNAVVNINNNPLLPFGGSYSNLCLDSLGADIDNDGFCGGSEDCIDTDPNSYPGAIEICDGLDNDCDTIVDNGNLATANTWLALSNDWHESQNWSTNIVPQKCHDVFLTPLSTDSIVIFATKNAIARSVTIGQYAILHIQNFGILGLDSVGVMINDGMLSVYGTMNIKDAIFGNNINLSNNGTMLIGASGTMTLANNIKGLFNSYSGMITNLGLLNINTTSSVGLDNYGILTNSGTIKTLNISGYEAIMRQNSQCINTSVGILDF